MYGIDRLDTEKDHNMLIYNMGGHDTEVSLVRYSSVTDPQNNKTYEYIEILAEVYQKDFGGSDFDYVLVNILADRFNALKERKGKPDVRGNAKALRRLLKESVKIKDVLSANKHNIIKISELLDDVTL
jgi:hypoxia up-regulated 1